MSKTEERDTVQSINTKIGSRERDIIFVHSMEFKDGKEVFERTYLYNTCLPNDAEMKAHELKESGKVVFIVTGKLRYI